MYDWLCDALEPPATVITANRRLARVLREEFAEQQLRDGRTAWPSPSIHAWPDWLARQPDRASGQASLPVRLNAHQSRLLWERCLAREFDDLAGFANLVRLSRDTWQRLADWRVSIRDVAKSAQNDDQRLFARVAGRYLGLLEHENWVDDAGTAALVLDLIESGRVPVEGRFTFAGFDREAPAVAVIRAALMARDCEVSIVGARAERGRVRIDSFDDGEAEMRAAGAWARNILSKNGDFRVAIVANKLERQSARAGRLVREGLVPGWQYAGPAARQAVNVSYGRKLSEYPAVAIALLTVRWLNRDLGAAEIGQLLRSPLLADDEMGPRSRLELKLRQLPDRKWSPAMISASLRADRDEAAGWSKLVASISKWRRELPRSASPAAWSLFVDEMLERSGWPGPGSLSSADFQLVNRWRELLNELARLDPVSPSMTLAEALQRLEQMAGETVFQPESKGAAVQLLGPLEASGVEFDALWVTGLTAADWPPAGSASPLVSRNLQRQRNMPDARPGDTLEYARSLLEHLLRSADEVICSYPLTDEDAEQTPSNLLDGIDTETTALVRDPGWHAAGLATTNSLFPVPDPVPAIAPGETLAGGAATLQRQLNEPFAAFVFGRLGVKVLQTQATGISPAMRGNILHDALFRLYRDTPSRSDIGAWTDDDLDHRLDEALRGAFARHERNSDPLLFELLKLERRRAGDLLRLFVRTDAERGDFEVAAVEHLVEFAEAAVRLQLRVDRIDRVAGTSLAILDYKTGTKKRFLQSDGTPADFQLVAYAHAVSDPVASLANVYIDSREISFVGAGQDYTDATEWLEMLEGWQEIVQRACNDMSEGDVRINGVQGPKDARSLNLLSRYTELSRDD